MTNNLEKLQKAIDIIDFVDVVKAAYPHVDDDTIIAFMENVGMDFEEFIKEYDNKIGFFAPKGTIKNEDNKLGYNEFEMRTLDEALKLNTNILRDLWNCFIDESGIYGEDSYIYDMRDKEDNEFLSEHLDEETANNLCDMAIKNKTALFQWRNLDDGSIKPIKDIKGTIKAYWSEILSRIVAFPSAYCDIQIEGYEIYHYFVYPIMCDELGIEDII